MTDNTSFSQNIQGVFNDLHNFVKTDSVLGVPVVVGDKTLIPVISVTLGYGSAGMPKKAQNDNTSNASGGMGLGARVSTSAVVVIEKNSTTMLTVGEKGNMAQMIDKIPQAISSIGQNMQGQQQGGMQNQQQSGQQNQQQGSTTK